ncbi:MAG: Gfo/Idh/MocA family oxidoreductase [Clostridia bacterium]|nr:Gfo/Idh/MocA family oxidoreductase [Clostridia bacterium]
MVKVGLVNLDITHPKAWGERMEYFCMDIKYHYLCNKGFRKADEEDWFVKRYNLEGKVNEIEDMVDKVDIGFIQSCNWDNHLDYAMPFIKKGKPVFIDKPMVGSVKDIKRAKELVKNGAKIIGCSSVRYAKEIREFLAKPVEERGEIISVFGTSGVDEFNYSVHIVEALSNIVGCKIVNNKFVGKTEKDGFSCEIYNMEFENGVVGTYHVGSGMWRPFHIVIFTTKGTFHIDIDTKDIYVNFIREIYKEVMGKPNEIADIDTILNCTEAMLCGKISKEEKDGEKIWVKDLPQDAAFDGNAFEKEYAAKSLIVYKD